ncbi:MAG: adenine deaminase [Deltaproteobacteria bacterium]|nr:adenine deaminase [Deltaproteobacteria bacterium]
MRTREQIERLIRGALGEIKADLVITGGHLVNVYSGELLSGMEIAVLDERICYVGPSAAHTRGPRTQHVDANGLVIAPGFIDAHTHISHLCRPYEYLEAYIAHGATAMITTCDELASVFGFEGVKLFLEEVERHPARVFTMLSMAAPQDPLLCSTRSFSQAEVAEALANPGMLGLGEIVSWARKLCAIAAAGVSSCHEPISEDDVLQRLRAGYWVMLREGSFRHDLEATLKPFVNDGLNPQRLILVTDSMAPDDIARNGYLDFVVRRAISLGLPPVQAIQAVTLNAATYCGLERDIGGIAPGRYADLVLLEEFEKVRVHSVYVGGKMAARAGRTLTPENAISFPTTMFHSLRVGSPIKPETFRIACSSPSVKIRVMELLNSTITAERILKLSPSSGAVEPDPDQDLMKVAVFDRHGTTGKTAFGFLKGLGARVGAIGTTSNLDENTLLVAGSSDKDMALCANVLLESGGGMAIADHGAILEKLDFPVGGIFSLEPWPTVGEGLTRIHRRLRDRGSRFPKGIYAVCFLTFATLPALRITARGLIAVKERKIVPLIVEE